MEYILTSLDMFTSIAENLINYSFNASFIYSILTVFATANRLPLSAGIK